MDRFDPDSRANAGVCQHLKALRHEGVAAIGRPEDYQRPYEALGTHPDLVAHLWDRMTVTLPADCRFVVFGSPALVRPDTGIVFAFAGGTHTYALRLPEDVRGRALAAGARRIMVYPKHPPLDLDTIGPEWVLGGWHKGEQDWCLSAYEFAYDGS